MKKRKYSFMQVIPLFLCVVMACTDVPDSDLELQPTELKVKILDENFNLVTDQTAKVYLYRDYVSFLTKTGEVATAFVGKNGYAHFTNLDPYNYFIYAVHTVGTNVYDNATSAFNLFDYLTENAITTVTVKTNLARTQDPAIVEISSIDIIPINVNTNWVGEDYDTVWTDYMIIRDYDGSKKISEQIVEAKATSYFPKKLKFGEFKYVHPVTGSLETLELALADLKYYDDPNPSKSSFVVYVTFFSSKSDFINRAQIYSENIAASGYYDYEVVTLSDDLLDATIGQNPYPQLQYLSQTYYQKNNYFIFTKLIWK